MVILECKNIITLKQTDNLQSEKKLQDGIYSIQLDGSFLKNKLNAFEVVVNGTKRVRKFQIESNASDLELINSLLKRAGSRSRVMVLISEAGETFIRNFGSFSIMTSLKIEENFICEKSTFEAKLIGGSGVIYDGNFFQTGSKTEIDLIIPLNAEERLILADAILKKATIKVEF